MPSGAPVKPYTVRASMKAPPKRKGNNQRVIKLRCLNTASMKAPPKRKGNLTASKMESTGEYASMKAPPKRKGNSQAGVARIFLEVAPQ